MIYFPYTGPFTAPNLSHLLKEVNLEVWDTSHPSIASHHTPIKITLKHPSTPIIIPQYPLGREGHMGLKLIIDQLKTSHLFIPVNPPYNTPILPVKKTQWFL
jgi:hypothetical protein